MHPRPAAALPARVLLYLPAYNAARTLEAALQEVPAGAAAEILLVDDGSRDGTPNLARRLGLRVIVHSVNRGYGASQKTAYREFLKSHADIVVMLHPDGQHDGSLVPRLTAPLAEGRCDVMLAARSGSRGEARAGGMPLYKYLANRALSGAQNICLGQSFSEWHTGCRAYTRRFIEAAPFERNSDGFLFDSEILLQAVMLGCRMGEIQMPIRYGPLASSISLLPSLGYAVGTMAAVGSCLLHRAGWRRDERWVAAARRGSDASGREMC